MPDESCFGDRAVGNTQWPTGLGVIAAWRLSVASALLKLAGPSTTVCPEQNQDQQADRGWVRQRFTKSSIRAVPTHITVSAPPQ